MENPTNFPIGSYFGQIWDYEDGSYSVWITDDLEDDTLGYSSRGRLPQLFDEFEGDEEVIEQLFKISLLGKTVVLKGEPTKWTVLEDNGDRVMVRAIDTDLSLPPIEVCAKKWIEEIQ